MLDELQRQRSATRFDRMWVPAERVKTFLAIVPDARPSVALPDVPQDVPSRTDALVTMVQGWMQHVGPTTVVDLATRLGLDPADVHEAFLRLEAAGSILRGRFRQNDEWCDRRLLARIHSLTIGRLRREIEPVTPAVLMRWLLEWQHIAPGSALTGEHGTLEVLRQLQGFEAPANAWEPWLLGRRLTGYDPAALDRLCLTGVVGWGRLSPHPATLTVVGASDGSHAKRRVIPTSVAPVTFFVREDADWMTTKQSVQGAELATGLSRQARAVLHHLQKAGASFFPDVVRITRLLKAEVETALWELVAAGLVTADGFDNLRALIDPRRRSGHGSGRSARPRHSAGRWSLLHAADLVDRPVQLEATCWMLLRRYGVVFRELLARESILPPWRELLTTFRRLEDRGEVRGGRFVSTFVGEQFATPAAVESLRAFRHAPATGQVITLSSADPLNLVGVIVPGDRVPAISGRVVRLRDGVALLDEVRDAVRATR